MILEGWIWNSHSLLCSNVGFKYGKEKGKPSPLGDKRERAVNFSPFYFSYFKVLDKPSTPTFQVSRSNKFWWILESPPIRPPITLPQVDGDALEPTSK